MINSKIVLRSGDLEAEIDIRVNDLGNLSISGSYGGSSGQIVDLISNDFSHCEYVPRLCEIWRDHHLNDMRAGCPHQRENWDLDAVIEVIEFVWSDEYCSMRSRVKSGELSADEYVRYCSITPLVNEALFRKRFKSVSRINDFSPTLLRDNWVVENERKNECAAMVDFGEHESGLLCKPCEDCGYRYGTSWLRSELPESVISDLGEIIAYWEGISDE
jgi:hypothetical protein